MSDPLLRVTHVIHGLGPGGAERVLLDLAEVAPAHGMSLHVLSLMPLEGHAYPDALRERGASVSTLDLGSRWDPRALRSAAGRVAEVRPQVVHTHLKHADLVGAFAARRLGIPMVSTLHLIEDAATGVGRVKRTLATAARTRAAARTVAVSDALRKWYLSTAGADPARVVTIPNGILAPAPVDPAVRTALRRELGIGPTTHLVTLVGVMRPGKGHAAAIEVARRLRPDLDVRVVLAGDGPLREELELLASSLPQPDRVVFAGYRGDVAALLDITDVLLSASDFDALPTALIEGLAAGVPAVAYAVGGVPEIVTPTTGVLCPAGDVGALADAVELLLDDDAARTALSEAARARFAEEFSADIWAERLLSLYRAVLPNGR